MTSSGERVYAYLCERQRFEFQYVAVLTLLAVGCFIYYTKIGAAPLRVYDEATYATVAEDIYRHGRWAAPRSYLNIGLSPNHPNVFFDKPPLAFWLQAAAMHAFGKSALAVRLPSATATILTSVVLFALVSSTVDKKTAFFSGLVFLLTPYLIFGFNGGRTGATDTLLTLLGTSYIAVFWYAGRTESRRLLLPMGAIVGLLLLTKGWAAAFFLFGIAPLVVRYRHLLPTKEFLASSVITAVIALPWPLYMAFTYGNDFIERFFGFFLVRPTSSSSFTLRHVENLATGAATYRPWTFFFAAGVVVVCYGLIRDRSELPDELYYVLWAIGILTSVSYFTPSEWHLMPFYAPAAVVVGILLSRVVEGDRPAIVAFGVAVGAAVYSGLYFHSPPPLGTIGFAIFSLALPAVGITSGGLKERLGREDFIALKTAAAPLLAILLVGSFVGTGFVPTSTSSNEKEMAHAINEEVPEGEVVYVEAAFDLPVHELAFVSDRRLDGYDGAPPPEAEYIVEIEPIPETADVRELKRTEAGSQTVVLYQAR